MNSGRSKYSTTFALLVFVNRTYRSADVLWLDYNARWVYQGTTLHYGDELWVNSYEFHPFILRDSNSGDILVANNKDAIYNPKPWTGGGRTTVYIDIPVYTLKDRCLQLVRALYSNLAPPQIPQTLCEELNTNKHQPYDIIMHFQVVL